MRAAYLILAHNNPTMIRRLVAALQCDGASFYVHVDGKVSPEPFVESLRDLPRVQFVEPAHIFDFLSRSNREYISFWRLEDRPSWLHKVQYYYPVELIPLQDYQDTIVRRAFWGAFLKSRRFMPKRRFPGGLTPYGGSQWWTLTHDCVGYVLEYVQEHEPFVRFYRTTHAPDEGFFQTIVMNSEFATRVANYDAYQAWRKEVEPWRPVSLEAEGARMLPESLFNLRYVDWSEEFTGKREIPAILDERDFDALSRSDCLFARKFDPRRSAALLDRIDRTLLTQNAI